MAPSKVQIEARKSKLDTRKNVLGSLLDQARSDTGVVQSLNSFEPSKPDSLNVIALSKLSRKPLEQLALFLGIDRVSIDQMYTNRTKLAWAIVRRFSRLLPSKCSECNSVYHNERNSTSVLECHLCGRGIHDCREVMATISVQQEAVNIQMIPSLSHMVWLCSECFSLPDVPNPNSTLPNSSCTTPSRSRTASTSSTTVHDDSRVADLLRGAIAITTSKQEVSGDVPDAAEGETEQGVVIGDENTLDEQVKVSEVKKDEDDQSVCKAFLDWSCEHGTRGDRLVNGSRCIYKHLPVCGPFLKSGSSVKGCTDSSCQLFHPKLCRYVQSETCCHDDKCNFFHPFDFRKARKTAIKAKSVKKPAPKNSQNSKGKGKGNGKGPKPNGNENFKLGKVNVGPHFQRFEGLVTRLIERMDYMEKRLDTMVSQAESSRTHHPPRMPLQVPWQPPLMQLQHYPPSQPVCY